MLFWGPSSIPVIGDYLSFFITSDITTISLFPVVIVIDGDNQDGGAMDIGATPVV
jgi:hypothetical protein